MNNSSLRPIPLQQFNVSREAAWQEEGKILQKSCALTEILTQPSHFHSGISSQMFWDNTSQLCCPVWGGLFSEAHGWQEWNVQGWTEMYNPPGELQADGSFPKMMSQVIPLL